MSSLNPRPPYSAEELSTLYPPNLQLHQVHVIFRHGERTSFLSHFQNAGVSTFWPYCRSASKFKATVLESNGDWSRLAYQRRIETFGKNSEAVLANGGADVMCLPGELTDRGRETTLNLGQRLRNLYVDQLGFLPSDLGLQSSFYLRASPVPRALESLQQVFVGLYPTAHRSSDASIPIIHERSFAQENLFPNDSNCRRFLMLTREFAKLAAVKWNDSPEMKHLQAKLGKWIEDDGSLDGHPRLSWIMDSVNSTLVHGPKTRLPAEFYEPEVREYLDKINVDEWFGGYSQSEEYRRLGIGSLLGDVVDRMLASTHGSPGKEGGLKVALMGCHDTTLAGLLASLGAFDNRWPPFTSSIAFEMFRKKELEQSKSLWSRLTGGAGGKTEEGYYVRLRYNDKPVVVKGCRKPGKHLEGDESFCTLTAFKEIVTKIRPKDRGKECLLDLDKQGLPPVEEVE